MCMACASNPRVDYWDYMPGCCPVCEGDICGHHWFWVCTCFTHHMRESMAMAPVCRYTLDMWDKLETSFTIWPFDENQARWHYGLAPVPVMAHAPAIMRDHEMAELWNWMT